MILLAGLLAYHRCLPYPFIFDDEEAIAENPYINTLWPPIYLHSAPAQSAVAGRPVVSLTLALNHHLGGLNPWGYRVFNVVIHLLGGLALFGIVRRTLSSARLRERFGGAATVLSAASALLWVLHPLQTESVTYIIQRCESLVGLFYLLTRYAAIRGFGSSRPLAWRILAVAACALGMATKEVMVTAPVLVLLYDRIFVADSFRAVFRARAKWYAALAGTWIILGLLVASGPRSVSAGFGLTDVTPLTYALSEFGVLVHYLALAFWPRFLCLDYWWPAARDAAELVPPMLVVLALLAATIWALRRRPPLGYLGVWFFLILAPTSSVIPILDLAFEHRMYLPLAAVCVLAVVLFYGAMDSVSRRLASSPYLPMASTMVLAAALAIALGVRTFQRNDDYRSSIAIWSDVVAQRPANPRGHINLAIALAAKGDLADALSHAEQAVRLRPDWAPTHDSLGQILVLAGRPEEAVPCFERALKIDPDYGEARFRLAHACLKLNQTQAALEQYDRVLKDNPDYTAARNDFAAMLIGLGRAPEAVEQLQQVLRLRPDWTGARQNLGLALAACGDFEAAVAAYQQALRLKPDYAEAHYNLANTLLRLGRNAAAIEQYREALRIKPDYVEAHFNLAGLLRSQGEAAEADAHLAAARQAALRSGDDALAHGRAADAAEAYRKATQADPTCAAAFSGLGRALMGLGRWDDATDALRRAVELNRDDAAARGALKEAESHQRSAPRE